MDGVLHGDWRARGQPFHLVLAIRLPLSAGVTPIQAGATIPGHPLFPTPTGEVQIHSGAPAFPMVSTTHGVLMAGMDTTGLDIHPGAGIPAGAPVGATIPGTEVGGTEAITDMATTDTAPGPGAITTTRFM